MEKVEVFNAELEIFNNIGNQLTSYAHHFDIEIHNLSSIENFTKNKEELERTIESLQGECATQAAHAQNKGAELLTQVSRLYCCCLSRVVLSPNFFENTRSSD